MATRFDPAHTDLPIIEAIPQVRQYLTESNTLILSTPPGAGKSTIVPLALLDEPWLHGRKIIMLEPRRLAASSIAHRMASLLGEKAGETVGYRVRFENQTSARTRIEVVTEGILTRMLHQDNALEDVGIVIFDEFHERRLHTDLSMVLCRESQQVLRPDLRLLVMSATLDTRQLAALLGAPTVESQGRMYPVEVIYTDEPDPRQLPEACARIIIRACREKQGDILAFLPGEAEIRACEQLLRANPAGAAIHPLYGQLSLAEQHAAIQPNRNGQRKIVLATSIAETSLTITGIAVVIDCGYTRTLVFDPPSGLSRLKTSRISRDAADQRTGRAGRLGPGTCYRMWSAATEQRMAAYRTPEVLEADLTSLLLDAAQWGIQDIKQLNWLTNPPSTTAAQARDLLHGLGALEEGKITPLGKAIHALPCHPRIAQMLLEGKRLGMASLATDIAALLEERDPLGREAGTDINLRIEALRKHRVFGNQGKRFDNIEKIARSYRKLLHTQAENEAIDPYHAGLLLAHAYPERIAKARGNANGTYQLANGKRAVVPPEDDLAHEPWLVIALLDARDGLGKAFLTSVVNPNDLSPFVQETQRIIWDTQKGGIVATQDRRIGNIVLSSSPLPSLDEDVAIEVICEAIRREGAQLLPFNGAIAQWQNRVLSLRQWRTKEGWPDVTTATLLQHPEQWLIPYLRGIRKAEELKKLDLHNMLHHSLDYNQQRALDHLAPATLDVPSGSTIKLHYSPQGESPVLAVRLQEVFGLIDTPRVNDGQMPIVLHLLSPGFKPVQVTADLRSFWQTAYFEIRKELKRRYPKHAWPEDPLKAQAIRGISKKPWVPKDAAD
ncbi:ATP-dependent helicase HrpB [Parapedobacter koreensis]|uniref:ATP-dependent helicase HrpB n=1 Tax=Parapedobacter koreensis TaxID=332977 RepID=A0A1H7MMR0_9SPHI|nr:ATP-dependent helicase HrpB [Parapedobacter koreensis]SEL12401.1 ATP-dependent helicase HrpB [Parapedobacter koreensis]